MGPLNKGCAIDQSKTNTPLRPRTQTIPRRNTIRQQGTQFLILWGFWTWRFLFTLVNKINKHTNKFCLSMRVIIENAINPDSLSVLCSYSLISHLQIQYPAPKTKKYISWDGCEYQNITLTKMNGLLVFIPMFFTCPCKGTERSCTTFKRTFKGTSPPPPHCCSTTKMHLWSHAKGIFVSTRSFPVWLMQCFMFPHWKTVTVTRKLRPTSRSLQMPSCCSWKSKDQRFQKTSGKRAAGL